MGFDVISPASDDRARATLRRGRPKSPFRLRGCATGLCRLLAAAGPNWRIAELRPGEHPIGALGTALDAGLGRDAEDGDSVERGPRSILTKLRDKPLPGRANLLILVDQFEELFRYERLRLRDEAEAFVGLLLGVGRQPEICVYVVLTMRSDFLGECATFEGLAETINTSMYLCPRLDRDQIAAAIERPAGVFGGLVQPALTTRLIDDMGTDPDQLPLMQHALLRLWEQASRRDPNEPQLRLDDYIDAGGLKGSLSGHADEILDSITDGVTEREETVWRMFALLVEGESVERAVRRATAISDIMAVTGRPFDTIAEIANAFRGPGRSFLMPPIDRELHEDAVLDISHESLIRQWDQMAVWVRTEAASAEQYREIERRARRRRDPVLGPASFRDLQGQGLHGIDLDVAFAWLDRERPNRAWARRYGGDFDLAMDFLEQSRVQRDRINALRRARDAREVEAAAKMRETTFE
jgi:hypothetical protein